MPALRPTRLHGETPRSFASRMAALNGVSLAEFCVDMGLDRRGLGRGDAHHALAIAELAEIDPRPFLRWSFTPAPELGKKLGWVGNALVRAPDQRRSVLRRCHLCARQDIEVGYGPAEACVAERAWHAPRYVTHCAEHCVPLSEIALEPNRADDIALPIDLDGVGVTDPAVAILSRWAMAEFLGDRTWTPGTFARMPLYALAATCGRVGAAAMFGPRTQVSRLSERETMGALFAGATMLRRERDGLGEFLDRTIELRRKETSRVHANSYLAGVFGNLMGWMQSVAGEAHYAPFIDLVVDLIQDRLPVPAGSFLGHTIGSQRRISVLSAAKECKLTPLRMNSMLVGKGLIPEGAMDPARTFDATGTADFLDCCAHSLTAKEIGPRIKAEGQAVLLVREGLVSPFLQFEKGGRTHAYYDARKIDEFVRRLAGSAGGGGTMNIPDAARRTRRTSLDVVRMLIDGKLDRITYDHERGYLGILVDPDEILEVAGKPAATFLSPRQIAIRWGVTWEVVLALVRHGKLKARTAVKSGRTWSKVSFQNVLLFERTYATTSQLCRQYGLGPSAKIFREIPTCDEFDPDLFRTRIYRRKDAERALGG